MQVRHRRFILLRAWNALRPVRSGVCITLHPKVLVVGGTSRLRERAKSQVSALQKGHTTATTPTTARKAEREGEQPSPPPHQVKDSKRQLLPIPAPTARTHLFRRRNVPSGQGETARPFRVPTRRVSKGAP